MANIIYPEPEKKDQWLKAMADVFRKGYINEQELYECYQLGGMPEDLLVKTKARMDLFWREFNFS